MKYSELKIDPTNERTQQILETFGKEAFGLQNMDSIIEDFHTHMSIFCDDGGDPVIQPGNETLAKSAMLNYLVFFLYGMVNGLNPDSTFRKKNELHKIEQVFKGIDKKAQEITQTKDIDTNVGPNNIKTK